MEINVLYEYAVTGGQLVVVSVSNNINSFTSGNEMTSGGFFWCMRDLWKAFVTEGQISQVYIIIVIEEIDLNKNSKNFILMRFTTFKRKGADV